MTTPSAPYHGPLSGIRVLDFTRVLSGPAASLALADLGAEVIKIEPPGTGDETRNFPPIRDGESHYFLSINRGKKSIVLDLKTAQAVQIAKDLAAKSDIIIENFRPDVMERLGLGYKILSAINPRLIYCGISGFGMTGPLRDQPSFDIVMQALSGALSVNGEKGQMPVKLGLPMGDLVGGINGPIAILAALYEREKTGKGCLIDISLLDGMFGLLAYLPQMAWFNDADPEPQGSQHPNLVPYGSFAASDGSIVIACLMNSFWGNICGALGMDDWADDHRFNSLEKRRDARDEVNARIESLTTLKTVGELVAIFTAHQVPHAPILAVREALAQPQAVAREMVVLTQHKTLGQIPIVNRSIRYVDAPQPTPSAPPVLGEHSDTVLRDILHFSDDQIAELRKAKVVS